MSNYDLTTVEGLKKAASSLSASDKVALGVLGPIGFLCKKLVEKGMELVDNESTIEAQRETAIDVIKAGKENGASSLELTLDQKAGIDIGSELEGIPLNFSVGKSGKMNIKVEYK